MEDKRDLNLKKVKKKSFWVGVLTGFLGLLILIISGLFIAGLVYRSRMMSPTSGIIKEGKRKVLSQETLDWTFYDLEENKHNLNGFKGKVIFLNFWATWCGPCVKEMDSIQKLYNRFKDDEEVEFILLSIEDKPTIDEFFKDKDYDFPVYRYEKKVPEQIKEKYIPNTYIINSEGKIVLHHRGMADWDSGKVRKLIEDSKK